MTWIHDSAEFVRALTGMDKMEFYTLLGIVAMLIVYRTWTSYQIAKGNQETLRVLSLIDAAKTWGVVGAVLWTVSRLK